LANRAWINWIRPSMLAEGMTYARVHEMEITSSTALSNRLNDQVFRFFKNQEERENMEPPRGPSWKSERGLI
jgi:hypothetical protein